MKFGVHIFPTENSIQPGELARAAEDRGLDSLWFSEHNVVANVMTGGAGDDILMGGAGDDSYVVNCGDGHDVISDAAGSDRVVFGGGILWNRVAVSQYGNDLVLSMNSSDDVRIANWFSGERIEQFLFADGTVLTDAHMDARIGVAPAVNNVPVVAVPISDQSAVEALVFSFQVPTGTFADPDAGDMLAYSASRSDGTALPGWLAFNPATQHFTGTPGSGDIGTFDVRVTATDVDGLSVSDSFALVVAPSPLNPIYGNEALIEARGWSIVQCDVASDRPHAIRRRSGSRRSRRAVTS